MSEYANFSAYQDPLNLEIQNYFAVKMLHEFVVYNNDFLTVLNKKYSRLLEKNGT